MVATKKKPATKKKAPGKKRTPKTPAEAAAIVAAPLPLPSELAPPSAFARLLAWFWEK